MTVPLKPWPNFLQDFDWQQGEHITIIGHTGSGKTKLATELLERRDYPLILACKPKDPIIKELKGKDYRVTRNWPMKHRFWRGFPNRVVLWPPAEKMSSRKRQEEIFKRAFEDAYHRGGYCLYADEIRYLTDTLDLKEECETIWLQGRTLNLSFVAATQRPTWIPLEAFSQATHLFLFRESDARNIQRLGEIGGVNTREVKETVGNLPKYHFLYVNTRDGELAVSKYQKVKV